MPLRLFFCFVLTSLCAVMGCVTVAPPPEAEPVEVVEIFRYADLGSLGQVVLGEPFQQRERLGVLTPDGGYRLRGRYTDTEAITVYADEENVVTSIRFDYDPEQRFAALVAAYTDALGPSTSGSRLGLQAASRVGGLGDAVRVGAAHVERS